MILVGRSELVGSSDSGSEEIYLPTTTLNDINDQIIKPTSDDRSMTLKISKM